MSTQVWRYGSSQIVVVDEDHPMFRGVPPGTGRLDPRTDGGRLIVRASDWPKLQQEIRFKQFMSRLLPGLYKSQPLQKVPQ